MLESVYTNERKISSEIYLVDNGSTDKSVRMVQAEFPKVKILANEKNEGFARANNQALRLARGRYLLLLNSDTVIVNDALNKMVTFLDNRLDVAVAGCKLSGKEGDLQLSAAWFPSILTPILGGILVPHVLSKIFGLRRFPGQIYLLPESHRFVQEVDWVSGACFMVRRTVLEDVGFLDENLFMYGEEIDWCFRIKKKGWKIAYFPEANVLHFQGGSAQQSSKNPVIKNRVVAERYIIRKHRGRLAALLYDMFMLNSALLKLPVWWYYSFLAPSSDLASNRSAMHREVILSVLKGNSDITSRRRAT